MSAVVKDPDEPTVIDEMADEAVPEPVEYPAGAPLLKPYVQIRPRSKRLMYPGSRPMQALQRIISSISS